MKRQLPEVVSGGRFVSGGELEAVQGEPQTPDELKLAVIALLQPGETVTRYVVIRTKKKIKVEIHVFIFFLFVCRALKRLRPARPQAGAKRGRGGGRGRGAHTDADAFLKALEPASDEGASDEARNHAMFDKLTEHASALLDLGFDDIYQDCREKLEASIQGRPNGCEGMRAAAKPVRLFFAHWRPPAEPLSNPSLMSGASSAASRCLCGTTRRLATRVRTSSDNERTTTSLSRHSRNLWRQQRLRLRQHLCPLQRRRRLG